MSLTQFDRGELSNEEAEAAVVADYETKIAALEYKAGQLTWSSSSSKSDAPALCGRQRELLHHHRPEAGSPSDGGQVIELPRRTFYYRASESSDARDGVCVRNAVHRHANGKTQRRRCLGAERSLLEKTR
jgi:hypothetical protein